MKTTEENLDDKQAEIIDIVSDIRHIISSLECAESCETPEDFDANIKEAIDLIKVSIKDLNKLL